MRLAVHPLAADDTPGIRLYAELRTSITPDDADSVSNAAWEDATYPGQVVRLLATVDGAPVATATTGRLHIFGPQHPAYYVGCWVLPEWRRRGIGTSLVDSAAEVARRAGKTGFQTWVSEDRVEGVAFLRHRGFEVIGRDKIVGMRLEGMAAPDPAPPAGFAIVPLAGRPDLVPGVHQVAVEAFPAIPSATPIDPGPLEEFMARDIDHAGIPPETFAVAIELATGQVAGYASLKLATAVPGLAYHDMTAVRPAYRGRGLAGALKRATIAWAIAAGIRELRTGNDEANAAMRAVNARLGYLPRPDYLAMRGPLRPER